MACAATVESTNDLECSICLQPYQDPCILPCKHSFCCDCLSKWVEASDDHTIVVCPKCKATTALSSNGIKHFLISRHSQGEDMSSLLQDSVKTKCTNCDEPGKAAAVRCMDCKDFLCDSCYKNHKEIKAIKHHTFIPVKDFNTATATAIDVRYCNKHEGEQKKYYCETCRCLICSDCLLLLHQPPEHQCLKLNEASEKFKEMLEKLVEECRNKRKDFEATIEHNDKVKTCVQVAAAEALMQLKEVEKKYITCLQTKLDRFRARFEKLEDERRASIDGIQSKLISALEKNDKTCKECVDLTKTGSSFDITSKFDSLSKELRGFTQDKLSQVNERLDNIRFRPAEICPPIIGLAAYEVKWTQCAQHGILLSRTTAPRTLVNHNGDILVQDDTDFVIYSRSRNDITKRHVFAGKCINKRNSVIVGCAVSSDNRYIIGYHTYKSKEVNFCDYSEQGQHLSHMGTFTHGESSLKFISTGLVLDRHGKIIIANRSTLYVCYGSGVLKHKFETKKAIIKFAVTSLGQLAVILQEKFMSPKLLYLMTINGDIINEIQPPPGTSNWKPSLICCSKHDEIFVASTTRITSTITHGTEVHVYRFTADGDYLDCVISDTYHMRYGSYLSNIECIISQDGNEIFLIYNGDNTVGGNQSVAKIFQRDLMM